MDEQKVVLRGESNSPVVVSRSEYRGEARLDVRRYFYASSGELVPTKKGVSLPIANGLAAQALEAMKMANGEVVTLDKGSRPVVIQWTTFKGRRMLDIRSYYTDDAGELQPTQKGVALPEDQGLPGEVVAAMEKILAGG